MRMIQKIQFCLKRLETKPQIIVFAIRQSDLIIKKYKEVLKNVLIL